MQSYSFILPIGGNDVLRTENFRYCYDSIVKVRENYPTTKIIVTELTKNNERYFDWVDADTYNAIEVEEFNLPFGKNFGVYQSNTDKVIVTDADVVFPPNYIDLIDDFVADKKFCFASYGYLFTNEEESEEWKKNPRYDFDGFETAYIKRPAERGGIGLGYSWIIDRSFYTDVVCGMCEDFSFSAEDCEFVTRCAATLCVDVKDLPKVPHRLLHLFHKNRTRLDKDPVLLYKLCRVTENSHQHYKPHYVNSRLKSVGVANPNGPTSIFRS